MNALENDPSYLFKAASKADHADTFIMERYEEELGKNIEIDAPELEEEVSLAGESHDMASTSEHQPESEMPRKCSLHRSVTCVCQKERVFNSYIAVIPALLV